ncbi:MAG: hypothetical protein ACLQSR_16020 [Limisphaerales bacterium]
MTLPLRISLSLLLLAPLAASAQTAGDFFDGGAQLYISNNIPAALDKTEQGLKLYPDDAKLKKLEELLKQQQQSQQNQQNQQNQRNQQSQSQQNQSQKNQSQQNQSQQQQSQPNQNSQAQNQQNQQQGQQPNQPNQANQPKAQQAQGQEKAGQDNNQQASAMTPEEAKRLLDAQKDNEQMLQFGPRGNPQNENPPVKDW